MRRWHGASRLPVKSAALPRQHPTPTRRFDCVPVPTFADANATINSMRPQMANPRVATLLMYLTGKRAGQRQGPRRDLSLTEQRVQQGRGGTVSCLNSRGSWRSRPIWGRCCHCYTCPVPRLSLDSSAPGPAAAAPRRRRRGGGDHIPGGPLDRLCGAGAAALHRVWGQGRGGEAPQGRRSSVLLPQSGRWVPITSGMVAGH